MKFHDELNPKIWDKTKEDVKLKPEVVSRLRGVAHAFSHYYEIPENAIKDIRVVGSSANYNYVYTDKYKSDLDLHMVLDYSKISKDSVLLNKYLWAAKQLFNTERDIKIYGIPLEVYCEPVGEEAVSNGIYSLDKGWVKVPKKLPPTDNDAAVSAKYKELKEAIEHILTSGGLNDEEEKITKQIYDMRKAGLAKEGEVSVENIVFKKLRADGLIDKLRTKTREKEDKELSLESLQEGLEEMDEVNDLISRLLAIQNYAKDIHYNVSYSSAYSKHVLMDLIQDDLYDFIDEIKENIIMGSRDLPLSSKAYMAKAITYIPEIIQDEDRMNIISLWGLIDDTRRVLKEMDGPSRGANAIYDNIAEYLDKRSGLLYMQTRLSSANQVNRMGEGLDEAEVKKEHTDGEEKPIDRKEYKVEDLEPSKAQKIGLKQSAEAAAVCEESALDRVSRKLGL